MEAIKLLSKNIQNIGTFALSNSLDWYGTGLERDYCLNWWHDAQANKIEIYIFSPLPHCELNYKQEQNLLVERFKKSELVDKVVKIGACRIDIYLK